MDGTFSSPADRRRMNDRPGSHREEAAASTSLTERKKEKRPSRVYHRRATLDRRSYGIKLLTVRLDGPTDAHYLIKS